MNYNDHKTDAHEGILCILAVLIRDLHEDGDHGNPAEHMGFPW